MKSNKYTMEEHIHRYTVWTAARAVQRGFTNTENISNAIDRINLRDFAFHEKFQSQNEYQKKHLKICNKLMRHLHKILGKEVKFGRAAKIVGIYMKTAVVIPSKGKDKRCKFIYPPIDRVLLQNIAKKENLKELKNEKWTEFDKADYSMVLTIIKNKSLPLNWTLEKYWQPVRD